MARILILHSPNFDGDIDEVKLMVSEVVRTALTNRTKNRRPKEIEPNSSKEELSGLGLELFIVIDSLNGLLTEEERRKTRQKIIDTLDRWIGASVRFDVALVLTLRRGETSSYYNLSIQPHECSMNYALERGEEAIEQHRLAKPMTQPAIDEAQGAALKKDIAEPLVEPV